MAGAVDAGGVRLLALFLLFLSVVNKVQFQQGCQGYQRLSTRAEGKGDVRKGGGKWRSHPQDIWRYVRDGARWWLEWADDAAETPPNRGTMEPKS